MKFLAYITLLFTFLISNEGRKANTAYNEGNYALADSLYRLAIEQEPENGKLHFNLGNALAKQGKTEEAIESFMNAIEFAENDDERALADYNIGTILAEKEEWKPAAHHFRKSLRNQPVDTDAKHNYELAALKSQEEEQQNQDQQNENQPPDPPTEYAKAMKKRAEQLVAEQRYNDAYNLMQQALQVDQTVQNYNDFIERINNVKTIDN